MTSQDIFDLRVTIAQALAAETDATKSAELQAQLDQLELDQARLRVLSAKKVIEKLERPIQRVEEIVQELGDQTIRDALHRIQDRLGLKKLKDVAPASPAPAPIPAPPVKTTTTTPPPPITPPATAAPAASNADPIPPAWMPAAPMERIILHWTAGNYFAGGLDKLAYHILIQGDGSLVRGKFSIANNAAELIWKPRNYAAHTAKANTRSIGVAVCCMAGATERPFKPGKAPMLELQFNRMMDVAAQLCDAYNIDVTDKTVLGHGEVEANLGIKQSNKWDPLVLPWDLSKSFADVGQILRDGIYARRTK